MKLYDLELSGNCYKVRLLLSLLAMPCEIVAVDFLGGEHRRAPLATLNPFAEIPVLVDGDTVLRDSQAILVYLARKAGREDWLPLDPAGLAGVAQWLMVAENEVARGPNDARLHDKFGYDLDVAAARRGADRLADILERHLAAREWLVLGRPTIADIAVFPYLALGHEGGAPIGERPAIRRWIARIAQLPGFVPMPEIELA